MGIESWLGRRRIALTKGRGYWRRARKSPVAASTKPRRTSIGKESVGTAGAATGSGVLVGVGLAVAVGVGLAVLVGVAVAVGVGLAVLVGVGLLVAVGVGLGVLVGARTVRVAEAGPPLGT